MDRFCSQASSLITKSVPDEFQHQLSQADLEAAIRDIPIVKLYLKDSQAPSSTFSELPPRCSSVQTPPRAKGVTEGNSDRAGFTGESALRVHRSDRTTNTMLTTGDARPSP